MFVICEIFSLFLEVREVILEDREAIWELQEAILRVQSHFCSSKSSTAKAGSADIQHLLIRVRVGGLLTSIHKFSALPLMPPTLIL
jgi:hypothetical protein